MTTATAPPPVGTRACPKCGHANEISVLECARCHVLVEKALKARMDAAEARERESTGWLGRLAAADRLSIKQEVERLEAWTGIETANSYSIRDGAGGFVAHAAEESGSMTHFMVRNWLKGARPFTMHVADSSNETVLVIKRPFRFFFSEVEVQDGSGRRLGSVQRKFAWFTRVYELVGQLPSETYEIHGPFFRPWTFRILRHVTECGLISKRWGGLGREMLTDADAFGIEFPVGITPGLKSVFLGAVFLLDFAHFEDNNRG